MSVVREEHITGTKYMTLVKSQSMKIKKFLSHFS